MAHKNPPQAFISSFSPRLRTYGNALLTPVVQPAVQLPHVRTTKRGTIAINYAEDGYEDDDFDSEGPRRPTGLRSLRRQEPVAEVAQQNSKLGRELHAPVELQGIWREWMAKPGKLITEKQQQIQCVLPLNLIPVRIDVDIASFRPDAALPPPNNPSQYGIDESLPPYRQGEATPAFRLKDAFLWNLHEALMTPDQFARRFVEELDFPADKRVVLVMEIAKQIRSQLEEYASVALHPLFQAAPGPAPTLAQAAANANATLPRSSTPALPAMNGTASALDTLAQTNGTSTPDGAKPGISASAERIKPLEPEDRYNLDDTYRCVVNLNVNLLNKLYSDRFEWSLVHPPGVAEAFARQTCADLGLGSEWVMAMSHAIYEAVLRLKKDVCENGGILLGYGELDNEAAFGAEAGWRFDPETLGEGWEPKLEELSKDEIEKREGDRERQLRRARRETARFSTTTNAAPAAQGDYFTFDSQEQPMGRGERSKKKRRFRSLSPLGRDTPDGGSKGYAGENGSLAEHERQYWRCAHCAIWGSAVWAVHDGPKGPRTLCHNCGFLYEKDKRLPPWSKNFFAIEAPYGSVRR